MVYIAIMNVADEAKMVVDEGGIVSRVIDSSGVCGYQPREKGYWYYQSMDDL